ncbi:MAG TPA: hypothetical protein VJX92_04765, partial [Methylomirabilota bacterium]|nr:hypothetical protein [Methylomirabilota bacterium]
DPARIWTREGAVRFLGEFAADWPLRDLAVAIVARGGAMPPPGVTVTPTPAGAARDAGFFDAVYLTTLTMTTAADLFPGRSIWALTPDELSRVSTHAGCLVGSVANSWTSGQPLVLVQPPSATTAAIADTTHPSGKPIGHYL